ncbi:MAG: lamin tail domain-containing protein [bacterium]
MKKAVVYSIILFLLMTKNVSATVFFSEIAWMGTTVSSTNEWIELFNDGDQSQNLDGWKIVSEDNNISINLSGTISAKGYYLIERTDDDSVANVPADLIATFGHGLSNAGETLYLKNDAGNTIESLNYTSGWPAGDVSTKDTMQKSGGVWITASATPKAGGTSQSSSITTNTTTTNTGGGLVAPNTSVAVKKEPVLPKEVVLISVPKSISVNLPIKLSAKVFGSWSENITTGYFVWSMGDGKSFTTNYLDKLAYHYERAGVYNVSLSYFVSQYQPEPTYIGSSTITVSKNTLSITKDNNVLLIKNTGEDDVDLSQSKIVDNDNIFVFPFGMKIVSKAEIPITQTVTGFSFVSPLLVSREGVLLASIAPIEVPQIAEVSANTYVVEDHSSKSIQRASVIDNNSIDLNAIDTDSLGANASDAGTTIPSWLIILALVVFVFVGAFVMYSKKKENPSVDEFSLIDE